jgi:hypothetical protein
VRVIGPGARPSAALSVLSGKGPNGFGPRGVNFFGTLAGLGALVAATQMPSMALPTHAVGGSPSNGGLTMSDYGPNGFGNGSQQAGLDAYAQSMKNDPAINWDQNILGPAGGNTTLAPTQNIAGPINDYLGGLNGPITTAPSGGLPGGLVPLGGGVFYDPDTGALRGGGLL